MSTSARRRLSLLLLPLLLSCATQPTGTSLPAPFPHDPAPHDSAHHVAESASTAEASADADFIRQRQPTAVRLINWNVRLSSVVAPDGVRQGAFERIVLATRPDVLCLQEIMLPEHRERLLETVQALFPDQTWHMHGVADNLIISRFPLRRRDGEEVILNPVPLPGLDEFYLGFAAALLDLPERFGGPDLYLFAVHNKSGSGEDSIAKRQRQSDAIMRTLRELRAGGLAAHTPIVIAGDLNVLVTEKDDPLQHLDTLLTGDIVDEANFGPDHAPDWDGSALQDLLPAHNGADKDAYTWRIDQTPYPPGALDRVLYTDSVLEVAHSYVLDTTTMSDEQLARAKLARDDVLFEATPGFFDHLPMVVDFALRP